MGGFITLSAEPPTYEEVKYGNYSIVTSADAVAEGTDRKRCWGSGGYRDIRDGTEVKVYDETGKLIATGKLGQGRAAQDGQLTTLTNSACMFPIAVADIPTGSKFYQVEVSHRGKVTVDNEPEDGKLFAFLTLGS
ncbi:hypothetical protein JOF56_008847 [Kibdelosporangium banguiense]|uniref:Uncharacterized protein n=1 Tax=Kibdelosporangium banguiense TaxID=1365924 RepID=A0ABS4TVM8_9PSEU|nr:hypothetical protein [Kibdelosporangium banguiense]MBP2328462.1 hypothetical protein [Kibdelosporangium banguiense]